jgi:hypothetical protein
LPQGDTRSPRRASRQYMAALSLLVTRAADLELALKLV